MLHFIDENYESKSILLKVVHKKESQSAENIAQAIREILDEYDLTSQYTLPVKERFIQRFVTDTTTVMPAMVQLLGFKWIPCAAHVLNLVVKDA